MQGTILIIDGVSTNRIVLKVLLSAAWYRVVQADRLQGLAAVLKRTRPDLIISAMTLPDGNAAELPAIAGAGGIPVIVIAPQNDRAARLAALAAGIDDVLHQPVDDNLLQARIRSLLRSRAVAEELETGDAGSGALGLAEAAGEFIVPERAAAVTLVTADAATGTLWRARLRALTPHRVARGLLDGVQDLMGDPVPDAMVIQLSGHGAQSGLELLSDLRARHATRHAALIAVTEHGNAGLAAEALNRGADDVLTEGFWAEELAMRLRTQLRHKRQSDRARDNLRDGLRASIRDPLTGLYNRRHALPFLQTVAADAARDGHGFAVMLADLDRFKRINDDHGHPAGDAVLAEAAKRFDAALEPTAMLARFGGEEFLIVLPGASPSAARAAANRLCRAIDARPFSVAGCARQLHVTTSIGIVAVAPGAAAVPGTEALIAEADAALYRAKGAGRNTVSMARPAA